MRRRAHKDDAAATEERATGQRFSASADEVVAKKCVSDAMRPGPAGLMARADTRAVVAMEVFVEQQVIAPERIVLELRRDAEHRAAPVARPAGRCAVSRAVISCRHLVEVIARPGSGRAFDSEVRLRSSRSS